jgi:hypothetical protein
LISKHITVPVSVLAGDDAGLVGVLASRHGGIDRHDDPHQVRDISMDWPARLLDQRAGPKGTGYVVQYLGVELLPAEPGALVLAYDLLQKRGAAVVSFGTASTRASPARTVCSASCSWALRIAEIGQHPVAHVLGDEPAGLSNEIGAAAVIRANDLAQIMRSRSRKPAPRHRRARRLLSGWRRQRDDISLTTAETR